MSSYDQRNVSGLSRDLKFELARFSAIRGTIPDSKCAVFRPIEVEADRRPDRLRAQD